MKKKIIIFTNDYKNVINLRYDLINFLKINYKIEVLIIDKIEKKLKNIYSLNKKYKSFNILKDIFLLFQIFFFLKKNKPDLIINFTLKPSIYGAITSSLLGIKSITVVTGLGSIYLNNITKSLYLFFMKFTFYLNSFVIFQNKSDREIFFKYKKKTKIINGSGFNNKKFKFIKKNNYKKNFKFLMVSRLIKDKGIFEYLEAAKNLKKKFNKKMKFYLMSSPDNSIFSFSKKNFLKYGKDVKFLNFSKDSYLKYLRSVDCFVLPSYREGFSKTLLEASSAGKVVLTTNVPGCRDIVINKKTGILCSAKSVKSLIFHMNYVYLLTKSQRSRISLAGSLRVNKKFSCDKINREYLEIIKKLI